MEAEWWPSRNIAIGKMEEREPNNAEGPLPRWFMKLKRICG